MNTTAFSCRAKSTNAKVGALSLAFAALVTLVLTHISISLAPLKIMSLALAAFAAWAFSDEMGIRKPLNRAAIVCFVAAVGARTLIELGVPASVEGRYYLLYAAFLLLATLLWSVAFLHRQGGIKIVGAAGLMATLAPIGLIVVGHVVVGIGSALGISSLLEATQGANVADTGFIVLAERVFGLWAYVASWLLWRGHIGATAQASVPVQHVA
jgi:hypothetical protein